MDWPNWVIPLVAVAIWIISQVARNAGAGQKGGAGQQPAPRPRANKTDIERFLEEINQRRRQQQQEPPRPQPQPQRRPAPEPIGRRSEPRPERRPEPPPQPQPQVRRPSPRPRPTQAQPPPRAARRTPEPVLVEVRPVAEPIPLALPAEPPPPPTSDPLFRPSQVTVRAPALSPQMRQLRRLLSSSEGMRTAIILGEVLGRPRCRRPFFGRHA